MSNLTAKLSTTTPVEIPSGYLNIMGYIDESEVNGPGCRAVVWVQGCKRGCTGCFNPDSWYFDINQLISIEELANKILNNPRNTGVTFSGGEPFLQASALAELAEILKARGLNVMSFSGFTLRELQSKNAPEGAEKLLSQLDILIDGPFIETLAIHSPNSLVSSSNQRVRVFNPALKNQLNWASDRLEIHVLKDGSRIFTGYWGQLGLGEN
ncbi:4Fe-4S single cluster domain-containing protein [Okeania sp. KiyG1]|uniref:4Fe-4S single cluster domain-containing protein n=1 Tax=Okeania sp. KiyG1 TaxID=2720165 RepID=UPI001924AC4D|nr:4Fe-4S single cluster domain-containing protein [Okeania sp. KiyG1]GGA07104.1 anaerobic ribonucleoside-triphosphate reductase-activating protein [Okeania sp. KiyG1]